MQEKNDEYHGENEPSQLSAGLDMKPLPLGNLVLLGEPIRIYMNRFRSFCVLFLFIGAD